MATFARVINGVVHDPVTVDSAEAAAALFGSAADLWVFSPVPDGTVHGARSNGDGTYTAPASQGAPAVLSKVAFMDIAYSQLGGFPAGVQRYGEVLAQARASASPMVVAAMERYTHASVFEKDDVAAFLDILVADSSVDLTEAERITVVDGWPDAVTA